MEYEFTLRLDRDPEPHADALYEAGLADALLHSDESGHYADFTRDAASFWDAITSAIADVQSTEVRVQGIDSDRLLTGVDIGEILGIARQSVSRIVREVADNGFPRPAARIGSRVVLYSRNAVLAWAWRTGRLPAEPAGPNERELGMVEALNSALTFRSSIRALDAQSLDRVRNLAGDVASEIASRRSTAALERRSARPAHGAGRALSPDRSPRRVGSTSLV